MKRAIVIGATSGIGRALTTVLVERGFTVGVTGRRQELLEELRLQHPGKIFTSAFDITDEKLVIGKLKALVAEIGGLDLLVLSSGTGHVNESLDFNLEKAALETNVLPFAQIAGWAFGFFKEQGSGHFVGITSIAGVRGGRHAPAYNASKAFQISYLAGLRHKVRKEKLPIVITDIRPGFVHTAMAKGENVFWSAPPQKAAQQIYWAIEKKKQWFISRAVGRLSRCYCDARRTWFMSEFETACEPVGCLNVTWAGNHSGT